MPLKSRIPHPNRRYPLVVSLTPDFFSANPSSDLHPTPQAISPSHKQQRSRQ